MSTMREWPGKSLFYTGDIVKIRNTPKPGWHGQIVEMRGPLGPNGEQIYRIEIYRKHAEENSDIEVREDQLELITPSEYRPADFVPHSAG